MSSLSSSAFSALFAVTVYKFLAFLMIYWNGNSYSYRRVISIFRKRWGGALLFIPLAFTPLPSVIQKEAEVSSPCFQGSTEKNVLLKLRNEMSLLMLSFIFRYCCNASQHISTQLARSCDVLERAVIPGFLFLIYSPVIGSQNHTDFKGTTQHPRVLPPAEPEVGYFSEPQLNWSSPSLSHMEMGQWT